MPQHLLVTTRDISGLGRCATVAIVRYTYMSRSYYRHQHQNIPLSLLHFLCNCSHPTQNAHIRGPYFAVDGAFGMWLQDCWGSRGQSRYMLTLTVCLGCTQRVADPVTWLAYVMREHQYQTVPTLSTLSPSLVKQKRTTSAPGPWQITPPLPPSHPQIYCCKTFFPTHYI